MAWPVANAEPRGTVRLQAASGDWAIKERRGIEASRRIKLPNYGDSLLNRSPWFTSAGALGFGPRLRGARARGVALQALDPSFRSERPPRRLGAPQCIEGT